MASVRAAAFDEWARRGAGAKMEEAHEHAGKNVLDRLAIGYDESFIDLGCGNGWAVRYVAEKIPTIGLCVGVDVSKELIGEARRLSAGRFPVKFLVAPIEQVPFGEGSFHYAFSMEALYYVEDPLAALKAIYRLVRPGGSLHFVADFYQENPLSAAWQVDIAVKMHYLAEAEWVGLFKDAGFADVRAERVLDERPVPAEMAFPWGGFKTRADLERFRREIGSLYIQGTKREASHALDPYLEPAKAELTQETSVGPAGAPSTVAGTPKKRWRFGRR